jgi:hypothetical protein
VTAAFRAQRGATRAEFTASAPNNGVGAGPPYSHHSCKGSCCSGGERTSLSFGGSGQGRPRSIRRWSSILDSFGIPSRRPAPGRTRETPTVRSLTRLASSDVRVRRQSALVTSWLRGPHARTLPGLRGRLRDTSSYEWSWRTEERVPPVHWKRHGEQRQPGTRGRQ